MPLTGQQSHIKEHARYIQKAETGGSQLLIIAVSVRTVE